MPEQIIVKHEIDLGQLERFEKALKEFKESGDVKKIVRQLAEMGDLQDKINKKKQEEVGIVGKLLSETKKLKQEQKETQDPKRLKEINSELKKIGEKLKKNKETTTGWSKAIGSFAFKFNVLANVISNVASVVTRKLNQAFREAIKTITQFESAMAGVRAISQATDEEFKKLRDDAIRLGGSTIFTARAVAELQMNYAKLGFSTTEILNATEATLALAAATDEDLARSALVAGSTLRAFNMDAIETQRVVDVMAQSFTSSALTLELWSESVKFSASIAHAAGLTVEGLASALQILADANVKGSIAGTGMKNILLNTVDATSKFAKTVGFTVGSTEDFIRALEVLKDKNVDLTDVLELSNLRSVNQLNILINSTEAYKENLKAANAARGAAQEMADIRMDTLQGSITILKSAWEGLIISAESATGVMTKGLRATVLVATSAVLELKKLLFTWESLAKTEGIQKAAKEIELQMRKIKGFSLEDQKKEIEEFVRLNKWQLAKVTRDYEDFFNSTGLEYQEFYKLLGMNVDEMELEFDLLTKQERKTAKVIIEDYQKRLRAVEIYELELKRVELRQNEIANNESYLLAKSDAEFKAFYTSRKKLAESEADLNFEIAVNQIKLTDHTLKEETRLIKEAAREQKVAKTEAQIKYLEDLKTIGSENTKLIETQIKTLRIFIKNLELPENEKKELLKSWFDADALSKEVDQGFKDFQTRAKAFYDIAHEQRKRTLYEEIKDNKERNEALKLLDLERQRFLYELEIDRLIFLQDKFGDEIGLYQAQIDKIKELIKNLKLKEAPEEAGPTGFLARLLGITDADERKMVVQLKRLGTFALNQFRSIADQQKQLIDETIRRYDQQVNELQRNLDIQLELSKQGKANRLQQVQEELTETQRLRSQALIEQEKAMERQRKIESTTQAISLATTVAELLKASSKFGPLFPIIAGIAIGAMFKIWRDSVGKIEGTLPRFTEGVVGFKGKGTETSDSNLVLMSRGETMTSAKGTRKYRGVLEGIHSDDVNAIWEAVTNDRNFSSKHKTIVNIDLNKTNKLLSEIVQHNKEIPKNFGSYVEYEKEGVIYRIEFDARKN